VTATQPFGNLSAVYQFCRIPLQPAEPLQQQAIQKIRNLCGFYALAVAVVVVCLTKLIHTGQQLAACREQAAVEVAELFSVLL
jgi:hypothetical protein